MFRRYDSSVADLTVEVASQPLYPGDLIDAEVVVRPRRSFVATFGLARLSQTELLRIDSAREAMPSGPLGRRRRGGGQQGPFSADFGFVKDAEMEAGVTYRYPVQLRLPLQAPPTVKGKQRAYYVGTIRVRGSKGGLGSQYRRTVGEPDAGEGGE